MKEFLKNKWLVLAVMLLVGMIIGYFLGAPHQNTSDIDQAQAVSQQKIWTCAMHPQIRQPEPGKCPICGMDLVPVKGTEQFGAGQVEPLAVVLSPEAMALAELRTEKVGFAAQEYRIDMTGKIALDERKLNSISASFSGRIERLYVDYTGQEVKRGQKLAGIYSPELISAQQELLEAFKRKKQNPELYEAALKKLALLKISPEQIKDVETAGRVQTVFNVFSDRTGIVVSRSKSSGDYLDRGEILFEIADTSSLWVLLDAYETDLAWIKKGDLIVFSVAALPGRTFEASVDFIDPLLDVKKRTAAVRAQVDNRELLLKPEMFVRAELHAARPMMMESPVIPRSALLWTGLRSVVFVKVPGRETPAFTMKEVTLGPRLGEYYLIPGGLEEGEEIVVNGVFAVDAAAQLSGGNSMMNRPLKKNNDAVEWLPGFDALVALYLELAQALVASDFAAATNFPDKLSASMLELDRESLTEPERSQWHRFQEETAEVLERAARVPDLETLRLEFSNLSNLLISVIEQLGPTRKTLYKAYCPMAFDDQGAYWISAEEKILNPYFGETMLRCGEIKGKLGLPASGRDAKPLRPQEHRH